MVQTSKQGKEIKRLLKQIANKRARIVIEHILSHGFITTEELEKTYGYNHPPRAARDVRESGIPLETFRVKDTDGRTIAACAKSAGSQEMRTKDDRRKRTNARFIEADYSRKENYFGIRKL